VRSGGSTAREGADSTVRGGQMNGYQKERGGGRRWDGGGLIKG